MSWLLSLQVLHCSFATELEIALRASSSLVLPQPAPTDGDASLLFQYAVVQNENFSDQCDVQAIYSLHDRGSMVHNINTGSTLRSWPDNAHPTVQTLLTALLHTDAPAIEDLMNDRSDKENA
jgi:hypothetical protein